MRLTKREATKGGDNPFKGVNHGLRSKGSQEQGNHNGESHPVGSKGFRSYANVLRNNNGQHRSNFNRG